MKMNINGYEVELDNFCEIKADETTQEALVDLGFATRIVAYYDNRLSRLYYKLNEKGITAATLGRFELEDTPDTPLFSELRKLYQRIAAT